jgi:hypothetical protein
MQNLVHGGEILNHTTLDALGSLDASPHRVQAARGGECDEVDGDQATPDVALGSISK